MSWWDYGYQITAMANRTSLVDNNTWNNTHISRVGQVKFDDEKKKNFQLNLFFFLSFRQCHQQKIKLMKSCVNLMLIMF